MITLDSTVGGSSANTYATLVEASAYFEANQQFSPTWEKYSAYAKAAMLVTSVRAMSRQFTFVGSEVYTDQALDFPRTNQTDYTIIPTKVKHAQLEMIWFLATKPDATTNTIERELESLAISGAITLKWRDNLVEEFKNRRVLGGTIEAVESLLKGFIRGSGTFDFTK